MEFLQTEVLSSRAKLLLQHSHSYYDSRLSKIASATGVIVAGSTWLWFGSRHIQVLSSGVVILVQCQIAVQYEIVKEYGSTSRASIANLRTGIQASRTFTTIRHERGHMARELQV